MDLGVFGKRVKSRSMESEIKLVKHRTMGHQYFWGGQGKRGKETERKSSESGRWETKWSYRSHGNSALVRMCYVMLQ